MLRAQADLATAEGSYFAEVVAYNQAQALLQLSKGTLLDTFGVELAEGKWTPRAYQQALRRAWERSHALPADDKRTDPAPFAVPEDERPCPIFAPSPPANDYVPGPLPPPVPVPAPAPERVPALAAPEPAPAPVPVDDEPADPDAAPPIDRERSPGDRVSPSDLVPGLDDLNPLDLDVDDILEGLDLAPPEDGEANGPTASAAEVVRRARRARLLDGPRRAAVVSVPTPRPAPAASRNAVIPAAAERPARGDLGGGWKPLKRRAKAEPAAAAAGPVAADRPVTLGEWVGGES